MKQHPAWFSLLRHDDPPADPPVTDPPADPPATGGKDWQAEAEKWKALSRKNEDQAKANAEAAKRLAEIEAQNQSDAEKLAARAEAAEKAAAQATSRAVRAEVRALADGFADREDAALNLGDLAQYVTNGEVDTAAIQAALAEVLTRKPHLAAQVTRTPAPDPSQGRGGTNQPPDFRTVDKAAFDAELAKYGLRSRSAR